MDIEKTFEEKLAEVEEKIKDSEQNFGETQVRDGILAKAEIYNEYKKYDLAIETFAVALKKTIQIGKKMDIHFQLVRIYLIQENVEKIKEHIDQCHQLLEKGGDWERKNKLKVYEGIYNLIIRDFQVAANLFVDVLPTFNCPEVITYDTLVFYAVVTAIISMDRLTLKKKVIESSEAIISLMKQPDVKDYLESFYECRYKEFFRSLLKMLQKIRGDTYLKNHQRYFIKETRVVVYAQFLESYKTVRLDSMATEFGVSAKFIDTQLSELISARRLPCKIDKVAGIIETDPTDKRNQCYKTGLKRGDHLLNQIQKLSRAIDV